MAIGRRTLALALALTPGIGGKTISRILARNDAKQLKPQEFLAIGEEALVEEYRLPRRVAARWSAEKKTWVSTACGVEERLDRYGVSLVTLADEHYPASIQEMDPNPPGVLFLYGNVSLLQARTFAVLCSRQSPPHALDVVEKLAEEGVLNGETLVAGHDTPEYQRAAVVPLRWGAPRILALDRGLFAALGDELKDEPFRTARLWRYQFDAYTDLAISAANPDLDWALEHNKIRDRLVASLAGRLDVVLAKPGGNMEKLAGLALKAGRPVRVSSLAENSSALAEAGASVMPDTLSPGH